MTQEQIEKMERCVKDMKNDMIRALSWSVKTGPPYITAGILPKIEINEQPKKPVFLKRLWDKLKAGVLHRPDKTKRGMK